MKADVSLGQAIGDGPVGGAGGGIGEASRENLDGACGFDEGGKDLARGAAAECQTAALRDEAPGERRQAVMQPPSRRASQSLGFVVQHVDRQNRAAGGMGGMQSRVVR